MKKKWFIAGSIILTGFIIIILFQGEWDVQKECLGDTNIEEIQIESDKKQKEEVRDRMRDYELSERVVQDDGENVQDKNKEIWIEEGRKKEKIELMEYIEFPIDKFIEETGIPLHQDHDNENLWKTEDDIVYVGVKNDQIVSLSISRLVGDKQIKQLIMEEKFPYMLAGICLNDDISFVEETALKDACHEKGMLNEEYYTSLWLSQLGIKYLKLCHDECGIGDISVNYDRTLKENAENLEYIWEKKEIHKSGIQNDILTVSEDINREEIKDLKKSDVIDETDVWINYPHLDIPGEPEMTQNANDVILEAVKKIEDNTYGKTDEHIIVTTDYVIDYISSKFISISFIVFVVGDSEEKSLYQRCNINIGKNGEKAYLADWGITKEKVAEECYSNGIIEQEDIEDYLKKYDTNWDKYSISVRECVLFVKDLDKGNELQDRDDIERLVKWYDWDIL